MYIEHARNILPMEYENMSLKIEVIAIGDEILTGFTANTNAAFIGQALLDIGLRVNSQRTLSDNPELLRAGLQQSHHDYDLTICTGGLGPTCDDLTRQVIAQVFDCELKFIPEIEKYLLDRYTNRPVSIVDQATIPAKAEYILNEIGTASALVFSEANKLMIFLPGIPTELKHFMRTKIIPMLMTKYKNETYEYHQQCNFLQLSESQIDPILRELSKEYPKVQFGIYPNLGIICVHIVSYFSTAAENLSYQQPIKEKLIAAFKENFFSDKSNDLSKIVTDLCENQKLRISLLQTTPDLNLGGKLAAVLQSYMYKREDRDLTKTIMSLLEDQDSNLAIVISGIPPMLHAEQVYEADLNIGIQQRSANAIIKSHKIRGTKLMLTTRAEHLVLAEMFKALNI